MQQTYVAMQQISSKVMKVAISFLITTLKFIHKFLFATFFNYGQPILNRHIRGFKEQAFRPLHDIETTQELNILEIGAGSGTNFKYLPTNCNIWCIEPNSWMRLYLRMKRNKNVIKIIEGTVEEVNELEPESMDAVISSFVLCSVGDIGKSMKKILHVLKKGGKYCFIEHTLSPDTASFTYQFQKYVQRIWRHIFLGCNSCNQPLLFIKDAGFFNVKYETAYMRSMFIAPNSLLYGIAEK